VIEVRVGVNKLDTGHLSQLPGSPQPCSEQRSVRGEIGGDARGHPSIGHLSGTPTLWRSSAAAARFGQKKARRGKSPSWLVRECGPSEGQRLITRRRM
jgi:hypothetical protein